MISTSTTALREALSRARLVAVRHSAMPMYANVVLHARPENAWLTITAAGVESQIALDVDADVDEPMSICVDAEKFALAMNVAGEKTKLSLDGERLKIATGKSIFRLPHQPAENFPVLLSQGDKIAAFDCEWLCAALKRVLPFTGSADHARMDSRGVSLKGSEGVVRIEGTTGAMLARLEHKIGFEGTFDVMLPRGTCDVLTQIESTKAILKHGTAVFLAENVQFVSVYLQYHMADSARVFPPADAQPITVNRKEFIEAVKSVAALSDVMLKRVKPVHLEVDGLGTMVIEAMGQSAEGRTDISVLEETPPWSGDFDAAFLLALAEADDSEKLALLPAKAPERLGIEADAMRAVATGMRP